MLTKLVNYIDSLPAAITHTALSLTLMVIVSVSIHNIQAGAAFGIAWACSRELRDYQKGSGYGLWAWLVPTLCCGGIALVATVFA